MKSIIKLGSVLTLALMFTLTVQAQDKAKRPSPMRTAVATIPNGEITVQYSAPQVKDRKIWDALVPYGKVWRTGANEATEITVSHKMKFGGKNLAPGTYSLFTIPDKDKWTVIVNKELGLWGHYDYKPDNDVLRIEVPSKRIKTTYESFTVRIDTSAQGTTLVLNWDDVEVSIPLGVE